MLSAASRILDATFTAVIRNDTSTSRPALGRNSQIAAIPRESGEGSN
jgi:hypothetical protein